MSGITGIFYRNGKDINPGLIKKMNDKLSHRGPDGSAVWIEGSIALGHQMMYTTQESLKENLPFHDKKTGLKITADARIDNRTELSEKLNIANTHDVSDSYFILKSYEKWGEKCPEYLLGDFAFAIWDENEKKLFCARDHMGVRPFYYYISDEIFVFASEIKSLFCIPEIPHKLNEIKLAFYLIPTFEEKELTFYKNISRLPSANLISINNQKIETLKYWELDPSLEIKLNSNEEYVKKFLELFHECIKCRLRSYLPIGFELSGGLDSSSIVCTAKKILNDKTNFSDMQTFSKTFKNIPESDESNFIKEVVNSGGIKPYSLNVDQISLLSHMDEIFSYFDEPFDDLIMATSWKFYEKINENQIRVLFRGLGGDTTLFHGHNYLKELTITFQWIKLYKEIKGFSKRFNKKQYHVILNQVIFPLIPEFVRKFIRSIKNIESRSNFDLINKELIEKLNLKNDNIIQENLILNEKNSKKTHYSILCSGGHQYFLEISNQRSAAFSIESVYPFYDKRLIEFCYAIPTEQKFSDGWGRMILRRAMKNILPEKIRWRPSKVNYSPVIKKNLLLNKAEYIEGLSNDLLKEFIDEDYIKKISKKDKFERYDLTDIMRIIILKLWLEKN
jgi:asparagine synthase (glutamine-hydrolysing)